MKHRERERLLKLADDIRQRDFEMAVWEPEAEQIGKFTWRYLLPSLGQWVGIAVVLFLFGIVIWK